ncbi:MAG: hypothetical protein KZQ73_01770 [Candidatus Thiodiazotropha sp. (ex Semelilucina semeliformis)]|nr:hypothetical protein [Candidatus Thiodiazotropha sp. (ex Myrtea spinifera)]MCU7806588.1 hypothetical protein [Candidatus Thiodiazotropha sp. (ex Semelilucina semeliformis)]
MADYRLIDNHYVLPTPGGAYHAVSHQEKDPTRNLLCALLREETSPLLTQKALETWSGLTGESAQETLFHIQNQDWIEGYTEARTTPPGALETILPELLPPLSASGKALLADSHGFYVAVAGFTHEAAVELSALSADIASLDARHYNLTRHNLRLTTNAWGLIDAAGNSSVGFWPLFIDEHRFVLIIQGVPQLNQPAFSSMVWALYTRYSNKGI